MDEFKSLTNDEKFAVIENLDARVDCWGIINLLSSSDLKSLDSGLLGELGRAYHNITDYEVAISIFNAVSEEGRDARWHYRLAFPTPRLQMVFRRIVNRMLIRFWLCSIRRLN